ncbi:hypothetical protein [Saccharopolyspora sp. ASAGF58]|nr:hypothetical protein [Saccharopolyspora sp. ASAGF58]
MRICDAHQDDWPEIRPFMQEIVTAGETFSWDRDIDEQRARQR